MPYTVAAYSIYGQINSLHKVIKKLFLFNNATLPSSAVVELFVVYCNRNSLADH